MRLIEKELSCLSSLDVGCFGAKKNVLKGFFDVLDDFSGKNLLIILLKIIRKYGKVINRIIGLFHVFFHSQNFK
jgi:hypothetical protein